MVSINLGKQIDDLVLLTILQNQIKNAVEENKIDISKFASVKHIEDIANITQEEKNDISKNLYNFLIDDTLHRVYLLIYSNSNWVYANFTTAFEIILVTTECQSYTKLSINKEVITDANGNVTQTDAYSYPAPEDFILKSAKYPDVIFYANYYSNTTDSIIYRFSSGIILDSSTETPQYKIVFASYNVKTAKVTFVEKVLE